MSQENVEVVRRGVDAINARDFDALADLVAPDVAWDDTEGFAGLRTVHKGPAELRHWLESVLEPWGDLQLAVEDIREAGDDSVYLETSMATRGKSSGVETAIRVWMVFWLTESKIAKRRLFWDRDAALEAAGLSE